MEHYFSLVTVTVFCLALYIGKRPKVKIPKNDFTVYRRKQQTALSTLIVEAVLVEMKSSKTIPNVSQIHELIGVYKPQTM